MTRRNRSEGILARRWRSLAIAAVLIVLSGAVFLVWLRIDAEERRTQQIIATEEQRAEQATAEADRRGDAVSTLAGDVRILRSQIQAEGGTPAAPDPAAAVDNLPDRVEVPVPIPGPSGATGARGSDGADGEDGENGLPGPVTSGRDGVDGVDGADGTDGADGAQGEPGVQGEKGETGETGPRGPVCPDGYSLQPPPGDPDGLMCRRADAEPPASENPGGPLGLGALALTAFYRRLDV